MTDDRWHVIVTREGRDWLAEVTGIYGGAHTHARSLPDLDRYVREVVVLGANLPDGTEADLFIDYEYRVAGADDAARRKAVQTRVEAARLTTEAQQRTARLARDYVSHGVPVRDVATMLGISRALVSQLTSSRKVA